MSEKKNEIEVDASEKLLSMTGIKGINIHDFIPEKLIKKLSAKFKDNVFFPILGIAFENDKKFILMFHESLESIEENKVMIMKLENISEKELKKFFEFVKKNKNGD